MIDIKQGDCLEIMKKIQDNSIDLIVTDPPYLMNYKTNHRKDKNHDFCTAIENDDNFDLIEKYIKECFRIAKNNTALYIFCNSNYIDYFKKQVQDAGYNIKNIIVWVKNNWTAGDLEAQYGKQYEFIIYANKGRKFINGDRITDVWKFDRIVGNYQYHQNQKPVELIERCIKKSSNENDLVFDGFLGSGTTAIACQNLKRNFIGCELEKRYVDITNKRLKNNATQLELF